VIAIAVTPFIHTWATLSVPLLLSGVFLMLVAIVLELLDLRKASATIRAESVDLLAKDEAR
jgi:hypothetical protein